MSMLTDTMTETLPSSSPEQNFLQHLSNPWLWLLGGVMLMILVMVLEFKEDWYTIITQWQGVNIKALLCAVLLFQLSHFFRARRLQSCLNNFFIKKSQADNLLERALVPYSQTLCISLQHQLANNLLPMRLGELVLPVLFKHQFGLRWRDGISSLLWLRFNDIFFMTLLGGGLLVLMLPSLFLVTVIAVLLACFGILIIARVFLSKLWCYLLGTSLLSIFMTTSPRSITVALGWLLLTSLAWMTKLAALCVLILSLESVGLELALSAALGAEFSGILPIHGVGGAGTFETFFVGVAALTSAFLAEPATDLLALALNAHIFILVNTVFAAFFCTLCLSIFSKINKVKTVS